MLKMVNVSRKEMVREIRKRVGQIGKIREFEEDVKLGRDTYTIGYGSFRKLYGFYWRKKQSFEFTSYPGNIYTPESEIRAIYENLDTVISVLEKHK